MSFFYRRSDLTHVPRIFPRHVLRKTRCIAIQLGVFGDDRRSGGRSGERRRNVRLCVRVAAPLTPPGQITRFSRTIFPQHVRQIRKHDVSPVGRRQGGETRRVDQERTVVRGGLLPAGNDETDGLLREVRRKKRKREKEKDPARVHRLRREELSRRPMERNPSVPQEGRRGRRRGSLMKCCHYRYRTKPTSTPADAHSPRATLLPTNTSFLKSHCGTDAFYSALHRRRHVHTDLHLNELRRLSSLLLCVSR